jgi:hypothetical protein
VSNEEYANRWDAIFQRDSSVKSDKPKEEEPVKEEPEKDEKDES